VGAEKVAKRRYRGKGATGYDAKREGTNKWKLENEGVEKLLPIGTKTVLDVPVGTGRFHYLYQQRGVVAIGLDTSLDMLKEAYNKGMTNLRCGDIRYMPFRKKSFGAVVCIRLFAWFEPKEVRQALRELARVSDTLIVNIRTNEEQSFCKSESLWNHYRPDFYRWVEEIGFHVDEVFHVGNKGNDIYRLVKA
jgi:ubiquinone/menaquinone biosynthesis C-methylase UbiE